MHVHRTAASCILAVTLVAAQPSLAEEPAMTDTQLTDLVARFETAVNGHDAALATDLFSPGFVDHAPWPGHTPDAAGFTAGLAEMTEAFPDFRVEVLQTVAQGNMVTWRFAVSGSQLGSFMGAPATGKTFNIEAVDILRIEEGRIAEHWGVMDSATMMEQLGL